MGSAVKNRSFSYRYVTGGALIAWFFLSAASAAAAGSPEQSSPAGAAGFQGRGVRGGFVSAQTFPPIAGFAPDWQRRFTAAVDADRRVQLASASALALVEESLSAAQLPQDASDAAAFFASVVGQVDSALRGGGSPVTLAAEVSHASPGRGDTAGGPRGRIDRGRPEVTRGQGGSGSAGGGAVNGSGIGGPLFRGNS